MVLILVKIALRFLGKSRSRSVGLVRDGGNKPRWEPEFAAPVPTPVL
jgi:hypothetical protein